MGCLGLIIALVVSRKAAWDASRRQLRHTVSLWTEKASCMSLFHMGEIEGGLEWGLDGERETLGKPLARGRDRETAHR